MSDCLWRVSRGGRIGIVAITVVWLVLAVDITVIGGVSGAAIAVLWAATVVMVIAFWRTTFVPYVALTDAEIVVQNVFVRSVISYSDVVRAEAGYYGVTIETRRGACVTAWAVQKSNWRSWLHSTSSRADKLAAAINERAQLAP